MLVATYYSTCSAFLYFFGYYPKPRTFCGNRYFQKPLSYKEYMAISAKYIYMVYHNKKKSVHKNATRNIGVIQECLQDFGKKIHHKFYL